MSRGLGDVYKRQSKGEVKQLKRIKAAVEAFCKELDKVKD